MTNIPNQPRICLIGSIHLFESTIFVLTSGEINLEFKYLTRIDDHASVQGALFC